MCKLYVNATVILALVISICYYCLEVKTLYPQWLIELYEEPLGRFMLYMSVYMISFYNEIIALLLLVIVVMVHVDIINLTKQ